MKNIRSILIFLFLGIIALTGYAKADLSACRDFGVTAKIEKRIAKLQDNIQNVESCDRDWLNFLQQPEAINLLKERILRLTVLDDRPPSYECRLSLDALEVDINRALAYVQDLQPSTQDCSDKHQYQRLSEKLPYATHFVMVGAAVVRQLPLPLDPFAKPYNMSQQGVIDTLPGGTPVQLIGQKNGWGFFRYLKGDGTHGDEGWIYMSLVYPIVQVR